MAAEACRDSKDASTPSCELGLSGGKTLHVAKRMDRITNSMKDDRKFDIASDSKNREREMDEETIPSNDRK